MKQISDMGARIPASEKEQNVSPVTGEIKRVGQELCDAMRAITAQVPAKSRSPQEFARTLKVHRTLASRLLKAIRTDDPLAALSRMPRSEGLRIILQAAKSAVPKDALERAESALHKFERILDQELGGWEGFDAVITEWLPEARERFELANRQLAYKGLANLMGVRADVQLDTSIYYPDASGQRYDIVLLEGMVNLHRLRPSARVPVASYMPSPGAPKPLHYHEHDMGDDQPGSRNPLLPQFCSSPNPKLEIVQTGEITNFILAGNEVGANSAIDVFAANVVRSGRPMYRNPDDPPIRSHISTGLNLPAKLLLMNVLMHEDIWQGDPQAMVYDMRIRGMAAPDDPARELDRIDTMDTVQPLGKGAARFRASEVGQHVEMVQYICDTMGWNSDKLRGYRLRVQYPMFNGQYCIAFNPLPIREG